MPIEPVNPNAFGPATERGYPHVGMVTANGIEPLETMLDTFSLIAGSAAT